MERNDIATQITKLSEVKDQIGKWLSELENVGRQNTRLYRELMYAEDEMKDAQIFLRRAAKEAPAYGPDDICEMSPEDWED